jgi:hypothetical protein
MEQPRNVTSETTLIQAQIAILKAQAEIARIVGGGLAEANAPLLPERDLSPLGRTPH